MDDINRWIARYNVYSQSYECIYTYTIDNIDIELPNIYAIILEETFCLFEKHIINDYTAEYYPDNNVDISFWRDNPKEISCITLTPNDIIIEIRIDNVRPVVAKQIINYSNIDILLNLLSKL